MKELTAFQRDTLYIVAKLGDPIGLDIKDDLDAYYRTDINYGRLYPNLDALAEMGLIDKVSTAGRTNKYSITARGRRELRARREWEDDRAGGLIEGVAD